MRALKQIVHFGWEQALSCLFPVVIFASLAITQMIPLPFLPRYDWLLMICVLMQLWMVRSGLETRDELKVITLFHLIGLALELLKSIWALGLIQKKDTPKYLEYLCIAALCTQV